jgi:serine/threonine protein kinase
MQSGNRSDWQVVGEPLGEGGQSTVYLVRGPARLNSRNKDIEQISSFNPWAVLPANNRSELVNNFLEAIADYGRAESPGELGALKDFKLRDNQQQAINRLKQEVEILGEDRPGLPKLLDSNVNERWMVTEYLPNGTLEGNLPRYKGDVRRALKAFLSLAKTVATLHEHKIVHRDIKPANVFVGQNDELILGDFGIVFVPDQPARLTRTSETVGPWEYIPPWVEAGGRLADVTPSIDIYMLGKLLWCMVSGRLRLQREWFERQDNNLTVIFPDDPAMHMVNEILRWCLVESSEQCQTSARDLVEIASTYVRILKRGGQLLHVDIPRACRVCGLGHYRDDGYAATQPRIPKGDPVGLRLWVSGSDSANLAVC